MFEGMSDDDKQKILDVIPFSLDDSDKYELFERIEDLMQWSFRNGIGAGRG